MSTASPSQPVPRQEMGFFSVTALVIGVQLGSAMFLLPNQLAPYGKWGLVSWILTGSGALALCQVFAALAYYEPLVGGPHVYVKRAFGKRWAFYVGWSYWVISWLSSIPLMGLAMSSLEHLVGDFSSLWRLMGQLGLLGAIMLLNLRGAVLSGAGEIVFSALKVVPMVLIPLLSLPFWQGDYLMVPGECAPLSCLNAASLLTFWGFIGLEAGTTVANCVSNARVVIPRALFWGTIVVIGIYVLNTAAVMAVFPASFLSQCLNPYSLLLEKIGGPLWGKALSGLAFIMCLGTLNSWLLASGQVAMIAAQEKMFPAFFGRTNRFGSPVIGIVGTTGALAVGLLCLHHHTLSTQIHSLINLSTSLFIMIYFVASLSLLKLLKKMPLPNPTSTKIALGVSFLFCSWSMLTTTGWILGASLLIPLIGGLLARSLRWPVW